MQEIKIPPLRGIPIEDLQIGHILWGWENQGNSTRKGWIIEPEGQEVRKVNEFDTRWEINNMPILKGRFAPRYILIEDRA
jgi:hypothetical protein